ncbi:methyltransferase domain-containing protein [Burkholderia sp. SIMBA_062]|uniref:methyltransferase domain-containing protein n=1 Tax=Burkholderia sp. SIMBA_062 TaxID=3085803 RepID=UPI00397A409B
MHRSRHREIAMSPGFIADDAPRPYDETFYRYQREGSVRSARGVLPSVNAVLRPASILDVGCGAGAWLSVHREFGVQDFTGIDGDYVDRSVLMFDPARFVPADISKRFDLGRAFDLVQCLEVGEHVPKASSEVLVDNLVRHGKHVLFSAAVPGQGGENHINEQRYEFWRDLFARHGYQLFDFVRPLIAADTRIEPWYRYNLLFFVAADEVERLPDAIRQHRIDRRSGVPDVSPRGYKARKFVLRWLPVRAKTWIAILKSRMVANRLKRNEGDR